MHVAFSQQHIIIPRSAIEKCGAPAGSLVMHGVCTCVIWIQIPTQQQQQVQRAVLLLFTFAFITPANCERASERSRLQPELLSFRSSSADGKPKMIFPHGHNLNHHVNRERQVKCAQLPVNKTGSCFNMLFSRHLFATSFLYRSPISIQIAICDHN
jgi:hypothetical protein